MAHGPDIYGFEPLGQSDLGGYGDGMSVMIEGDVGYIGHFGPCRSSGTMHAIQHLRGDDHRF